MAIIDQVVGYNQYCSQFPIFFTTNHRQIAMAEFYADNKVAQVSIAVSLSILIVTNLTGNSLVILINVKYTSMKSPMNYLLVNLAVADIMVGLFLAPRLIFSHFFDHPDGITGKVLCSLLTASNLTRIGVVSSSFSLVAISIERYFAIAHPLSTRYRLSIKQVKRTIVVCWIVSIVLVLPLFYFRIYDKNHNLCIEQWPTSPQLSWLAGAYSVLWFGFVGIAPITIMVTLYAKVVYKLWFDRSAQQGTQYVVLRWRKRVTKMFVIVSVIYVVCVFPNLTLYLVDHSNQLHRYNVRYIVSAVMFACNSTINPFVYTLQSSNFRLHMKRFVCCEKSRVHIKPSSTEHVQKHFPMPD